MAYTALFGFGGITRDIAMEAITYFRTTDCTVSAADAARVVAPGIRYIICPTDTANAKAIMPIGTATTGATNVMDVLQAYVGLETTPSSSVGLITADTAGGARLVVINTSLQLEFYNNAGTLLATSTKTISTTGMTLVQISATKARADNSAATGIWVQLWMDNVLDLAFLTNTDFLNDNSGDLCWGEWLTGGADRGADLYLAHVTYRQSDVLITPADAPWLTAYPKIQIVGGSQIPGTAMGTYDEWDVGTGSFDYLETDDFLAADSNDGDTTYVAETSNDFRHTYTYSAANPTDSGDTIQHVLMRRVGRLVDAAKTNTFFLLRLGGTDATTVTPVPGTTYVGLVAEVTKPGGGAWAYTDFAVSGVSALEFGLQTPASPFTPGERTTSLPGPEIWKSEESMTFGRYPYQQPCMGAGYY